LYSPRSSVTVVRTRSMSAGLVASTVTPGTTAPEASLTKPAMFAVLVPCAFAAVGSIQNAPATANAYPSKKRPRTLLPRILPDVFLVFIPPPPPERPPPPEPTPPRKNLSGLGSPSFSDPKTRQLLPSLQFRRASAEGNKPN